MRWYVASAMRGFVGAVALFLVGAVFVSTFLMIYVGIVGTGPFTTDPPPNHIPWVGIAIVLAITAALEGLIVWGWRALKRVLDAAEAE